LALLVMPVGGEGEGGGGRARSEIKAALVFRRANLKKQTKRGRINHPGVV